MSDHKSGLFDQMPDLLRRSEAEAPIPSWEQVAGSCEIGHSERASHVVRIISGTTSAGLAEERWRTWPERCRRSVALLIDKICNEGWLESVGPLKGWPWDGGFYFWPRRGGRGLSAALDAKSGEGGAYVRCSFREGLAAYLARWNHREWKRAWIETDSAFGSVHVGIFNDGSAEVHLDVFNPHFTNGAPRSHVTRLPWIGCYNHKLFRLHRAWEGPRYGPIARRSANLYHLMRSRVPLSF